MIMKSHVLARVDRQFINLQQNIRVNVHKSKIILNLNVVLINECRRYRVSLPLTTYQYKERIRE